MTTAGRGLTRQARIGDVVIDLVARAAVLDRFDQALGGDPAARAAVVVSANLDHVHHFADRQQLPSGARGDVEWLTLLDGHPIARSVRRRVRSRSTPALLPGSELLEPALELAARRGSRVALVGAG